MKEVNPNKIKKSEIIVGIPSYNKADSISNVIKKVDQEASQKGIIVKK